MKIILQHNSLRGISSAKERAVIKAAVVFFSCCLLLLLYRHYSFYSSYDQGIFNQIFGIANTEIYLKALYHPCYPLK